MFKWTVDFYIDPIWVKDGFDMTDERAQAMIENTISHAYGDEVKAVVTKSPTKRSILVVQGYNEKEIRIELKKIQDAHLARKAAQAEREKARLKTD